MSGMFLLCMSLSSLPNISKWKTQNVTNMSCMFYVCSSLSSLPDIPKWDILKVTIMDRMLYNFSSLTTLSDLNIKDVILKEDVLNGTKFKIPKNFKKEKGDCIIY